MSPERGDRRCKPGRRASHGRLDASGGFFESVGGSLIHSRATHQNIVERVAFEDDVRTFRISTNTLGAGFIECVANETLLAIRDAQPEALRGTAIMVPVLEAASAPRLGRFGWKNQHASLESFAADAYLNEMGITTPLFPDENTSAGKFVGYGSGYDRVPDPEDDGVDVVAFANFMRSTKAPSRGRVTGEVVAGEGLFNQVGCNSCHVATLRTARPGTRINGGAFTVPAALGNKLFHPYSDFLLHDIGTGDGIPLLPGPEYAGTASRSARRRSGLCGRAIVDARRSVVQQAGGDRAARGPAAQVRDRYDALPTSSAASFCIPRSCERATRPAKSGDGRTARRSNARLVVRAVFGRSLKQSPASETLIRQYVTFD
jgi:hypothetical protein